MKKVKATPKKSEPKEPRKKRTLSFLERHEAMKASLFILIQTWRKAGATQHEIVQHLQARVEELETGGWNYA